MLGDGDVDAEEDKLSQVASQGKKEVRLAEARINSMEAKLQRRGAMQQNLKSFEHAATGLDHSNIVDGVLHNDAVAEEAKTLRNLATLDEQMKNYDAKNDVGDASPSYSAAQTKIDEQAKKADEAEKKGQETIAQLKKQVDQQAQVKKDMKDVMAAAKKAAAQAATMAKASKGHKMLGDGDVDAEEDKLQVEASHELAMVSSAKKAVASIETHFDARARHVERIQQQLHDFKLEANIAARRAASIQENTDPDELGEEFDTDEQEEQLVQMEDEETKDLVQETNRAIRKFADNTSAG